MGYLVLLLLLIGVVWFVSAPLRRAVAAPPGRTGPEPDSMLRIDLEAARDAKYREIRDTELDHETGKLSDEDFAAIDSTLRSEAIALLHQIDELDELDDAAAPEDEAPSAE